MNPCARPGPLIWHFYLLSAILGIFASVWPFQALVCLLVACLLQPGHPGRLAFALAAFLGCFWFASGPLADSRVIIAEPPSWIFEKSREICAKIRNVQGLPDKRLRIILNEIESDAGSLPGLAAWNWDQPSVVPVPGQKVCVARPIRPTGGFANQGGDTWAIQNMTRGINWRIWSREDGGAPHFSGTGSLFARVRADIHTTFISALGGEGEMTQAKAILPALLFGDRYFLNQYTVTAFANATLAHSLALSGQHLAIVCLLAFELVTIVGWIFPNIYLLKPRHILVFALSIPLAICYLWLGNAPPSLMRAAAMLLLLAIWQWRHVSFASTDIICAAVACILLFNPLLVFDTGFQLSVICVGTIILLWPGLLHFANRLIPQNTPTAKIAKKLLLILLLSLVIQTALLPLSLILFQMAGFLFPLNALWLPALACITLPFAVLGLFLLPVSMGVAGKILNFAAIPGGWMLELLHWLEARQLLVEPAFLIPPWTALPAFALLTVGMACIWGGATRKGRAFLVVALLFLLAGPVARLTRPEAITIEAIDVGQAQSILVTLSDGERILIDGGGTASPRFDTGRAIVRPFLTANHAPELSAVFNTHPDVDHLGGLFHIFDVFPVGGAFSNGREAHKSWGPRWEEYKQRHHVQTLKAGDEIRLSDGSILEILHPPPDEAQWSGNSASLVMRLVKDGRGLALFPGDAGKDALQRLVAEGRGMEAEIVFAPHHGSDKNFWRPFLEKANPKLVIAACGRYNRWHYPGKKLSAFLQARGVPLLNTGEMGKIAVSIPPNGTLEVETARD